MSKLKRKKKEEEVMEQEQEHDESEAQETEESQESQETEAASKFRDKLEAYQAKQQSLLRISEVDLNEDFVSQAPNYVAAATKFHKANQVLSLEKQKLEEVMAEVYLNAKSGTEKTTEAHLDKLCKNDPSALKQKKRLILAEYQVGIHQAMMRGWEHKRDMLIQVGSFARAEMAGQVSINKNHPNHDDVARSKNGRPTSL